MDNKQIIQILKQTASLLELYGENPFKIRSYQTAVYNLERTNLELKQLDKAKLSELPGVGKSIAATIYEINQTGSSGSLDNLLKQTPKGILELLEIKGIAARKIKTAWDELGVESAEELLQASKQNQLADLPGFGKKTQDKLHQIVSFYLSNKGLIHYKQAHQQGVKFEAKLLKEFPEIKLSRTGGFRRKLEIVASLQYVLATDNVEAVEEYLDGLDQLSKNHARSGPFRWKGVFNQHSVPVDLRFCSAGEFGSKLVYYTGSIEHLSLTNEQGKSIAEAIDQMHGSEQQVYASLGWPLIIPELREGRIESNFLDTVAMDNIIKPEDLRGILHNHSTYSDGKNSLEDMALACRELGYEYFGISDHSQTAVYANGLDEARIKQQHQEIDELNKKLAPFRIFKGIESDILNDGNLDYPEAVLNTFDFVVASIHFNINMDIDQATNRLVRAIENPFTTILGHPTGRQLLKREGYPIDHAKVIDACAKNQVAIEINAHPWRLDLDWRWVNYAIEKGVKISINPDAHEVNAIQDVYYGVCVARKAGLPRTMTLNAMPLDQLIDYFSSRKTHLPTHSATPDDMVAG